MKYRMTTIYNGTRIREEHSTYTKVFGSVNAGITLEGDELWTAPADGSYVKKGDQWLHVTHGAVTGWTAYTYLGQPICQDLKQVDENPDVPPVLNKNFPEYFTLESPTGERKRYNKVD